MNTSAPSCVGRAGRVQVRHPLVLVLLGLGCLRQRPRMPCVSSPKPGAALRAMLSRLTHLFSPLTDLTTVAPYPGTAKTKPPKRNRQKRNHQKKKKKTTHKGPSGAKPAQGGADRGDAHPRRIHLHPAHHRLQPKGRAHAGHHRGEICRRL